MVHRALLGSLERFFGVLVEHHGGAFPVWLAPTQAVVLSVGERHADAAEALSREMKEQRLRVDADTSGWKIGAKIRHHLWQEKIPLVAVIGDQEIDADMVAVRSRKDGDLGVMSTANFAALLRNCETERR